MGKWVGMSIDEKKVNLYKLFNETALFNSK